MQRSTAIKRFSVLFAVVGELSIAGFLFWFYETPGTIGLFRWNPQYMAIFRKMELILLIIPVLAVLLFVLKHSPLRKTFSGIVFADTFLMVVSVICIVGSIFGISYFTYRSGKISMVYTKIPNIIDTGNSLPARTAETEDTPLMHVAFCSDPHWGSDSSDNIKRTEIMKQIDSRDYDVFFCLGDISWEGSQTGSFEPATNDFRKYLKNVPVRIVMGNHDATLNADKKFSTCFYGGKNASLYYRIDGGRVHFIVLNLLWDATEFKSKQKEWFIKQLKEIPETDTVIVMSHCFILSSGYHDDATDTNWYDIPSMIKEICPILEKYHVDLVVSGHNHLMELLKKAGVTYTVIGTMGGKLDSDVHYISPYNEWLNPVTYGWLDVTVYENKLKLLFYDYTGKAMYSQMIKINTD